MQTRAALVSLWGTRAYTHPFQVRQEYVSHDVQGLLAHGIDTQVKSGTCSRSFCNFMAKDLVFGGARHGSRGAALCRVSLVVVGFVSASNHDDLFFLFVRKY